MAIQQRGEETRWRIMAAATACFGERGYDATGVAEICQRAGVSKGAFYHHFASKQALFVALLDQWLAVLDGQLTRLAVPAATVPQALQAMVALLQQVFRDASGQLPVYLEFWRQAARDPAIWQAAVAPFQRYRDLLAGMIGAGVAEGTLQPCNPDDVARVLVSMAVGMVLQSALEPASDDWERSAEAGVQLILRGLLNP